MKTFKQSYICCIMFRLLQPASTEEYEAVEAGQIGRELNAEENLGDEEVTNAEVKGRLLKRPASFTDESCSPACPAWVQNTITINP